MEELLERIAKTKSAYGITNKQIAAETGMHYITVCKQLEGMYKVDIAIVIALAKMCDGLDCTWLLTGRSAPIPKSDSEMTAEQRISLLERQVQSLLALQNTNPEG